jgi:hypothetical protein
MKQRFTKSELLAGCEAQRRHTPGLTARQFLLNQG